MIADSRYHKVRNKLFSLHIPLDLRVEGKLQITQQTIFIVDMNKNIVKTVSTSLKLKYLRWVCHFVGWQLLCFEL